MAVEFVIQASNPRALRVRDPSVDNLSDAIETVFPMMTEKAFLVWNHVYVPLGYKYDMCLLVDDIMLLTENIMSKPSGTERVCWPSNTFATTWDVVWRSEVVAVQAEWDRVVGDTESILATRPYISIPQVEFLSEWKQPLVVVRNALKGAGYTYDQIADLRRLDDVIERLPRNGQLYCDTEQIKVLS